VAADEPRVADLLVQCLENEGVTCVFGIPGEENIRLTDALVRSSIRYILVRHEQAASFMAELHGRLTGRAGVCSSTLGPGAINLLLGTADANSNSTPMVAISAQVGLGRIYKESHQSVDLVAMFAPVTKWADMVLTPGAVPEMVRKAFKLAQTERPGAVFLAVPEDIEALPVSPELRPLAVNTPRPDEPSPSQIERAATVLDGARRPIVLAGHGAARGGAAEALRRFSDSLGLPVATTFHGKGVFPDDHPHALGAVGFMSHDYVNFDFDEADVIISVGYELQEFDPVRINPEGDKRIIHLSRVPAEVDAHYDVEVGVQADIGRTLDALGAAVTSRFHVGASGERIRKLLAEEFARGAADDSFPLKPQRVVADIRAALGRADIVLADTGAVKMWMARLYPTYEPNTCLVSNGLSTMGFALPGALAAKLALPERRVLAAVRERIPLAVLIWQDDAYGLIKWKMNLEIGRDVATDFSNPDFVAYAESFGARGYQVRAADDLLPMLHEALASEGVSVVACPVDYAENLRLTGALGDLTGPF
jgi:acetolactate synthase I/II/III large subunit